MINFKSIPNDLSWFARRYKALLVTFPDEITPSILNKDLLCSRYDSEEVVESLKSAHEFLTLIAEEILSLPAQYDERKEHIEKTIYKLEAIWGLMFSSELHEDKNEYCIAFKKPLKSGLKTLPPNYSKPLQNLEENGCWIEYFKGNNETKNFKSCDNGILHFNDRLTALGIYIFIKKCTQKRWYRKEDTAGGYTKKLQYTPILHCIEPYYRVDMRIFVCGDRLNYNINEQLASYNDCLINCFNKIYHFVHNNYPDCLPDNGIYGYTMSSVTFGVDTNHRMIGQIGVGSHENKLGFYAALTGKEMDTLLADIDSFGEKVTMQFLHEIECECKLCTNKIRTLFYRGKKYNRVYKNTENRFSIENENDADLAIKCIDIKAKCNMNTRKNSKERRIK